MKFTWIASIAAAALFLEACPYYCSHESIKLPSTPLNLAKLNSPYDDWNCGIPWEEAHVGMSFLFSSNRSTQGGTFDLTPHNLVLQGEGNVAVDSNPYDASVEQMKRLATIVNTDSDELGPTFFGTYTGDNSAWLGALVFSRGTGNNHHLHVLSSLASPYELMTYRDSLAGLADSVSDRELTRLNSNADDGYMAYSESTHRVLFHSNREGKYHIYQVTLPDNTSIQQWLTGSDTTADIVRVDALVGTDGEERCPSLHGDTLLFVSDRTGGNGGFDIYRSIWNGKEWQAPTNLGSKVNSSSDEYRPVQLAFEEGQGIIYSSNRPGGKGGYDLYLVKMP